MDQHIYMTKVGIENIFAFLGFEKFYGIVWNICRENLALEIGVTANLLLTLILPEVLTI